MESPGEFKGSLEDEGLVSSEMEAGERGNFHTEQSTFFALQSLVIQACPAGNKTEHPDGLIHRIPATFLKSDIGIFCAKFDTLFTDFILKKGVLLFPKVKGFDEELFDEGWDCDWRERLSSNGVGHSVGNEPRES